MILRENFTSEHITRLQLETGADPSIIERTIFALGLLEAIKRVNMPFIFKGGTSLLLLLKNPKRLSTDIDIIVEPETNIDNYIKEAGKIFPFINVDEVQRKNTNNIKKRHFKFLFRSPKSTNDINILLDVVFVKNPYPKIIELPVKSSILLSEGPDHTVNIPDINCILGDKLTAFAPHTTGIPFGIDKELEIIKQLFDCWTLIQEFNNLEIVSTTYNQTSTIESKYRNLNINSSDCLKDTIASCICILSRGSIRPEEYKNYSHGINALQGHLISGRMTGENACSYAAGVMYLATCLLSNKNRVEKITNPEQYRDIKLPVKGIKRISGIKNYDPTAYAYVIKSLLVLQKLGLYTDSIE